MQVDPIKPMLKSPGTKPFKLEYDEVLSRFAFTSNMRRYIQERTGAHVLIFKPRPGAVDTGPRPVVIKGSRGAVDAASGELRRAVRDYEGGGGGDGRRESGGGGGGGGDHYGGRDPYGRGPDLRENIGAAPCGGPGGGYGGGGGGHDGDIIEVRRCRLTL